MNVVDTTPELVALFRDNGITLISESKQDSVNTYPMVTYSDDENIDDIVGDNTGYSSIAYTINVWARSKADCVRVSREVDAIMKSADFTRVGGMPQNYGGLYRSIWTYRRLVWESF